MPDSAFIGDTMITSTRMSGFQSKKYRKTIHAEHDRISNLPDCVLSHILSRIPTKAAVRTSILSKDWKFKWTSIYKIELDDAMRSGHESEKTAFVNFVERTLLLTQNVESLGLACREKYGISHTKTWISAALSHNIHYLNVYCSFGDIVLPRDLLNCVSLRELHLDFFPSGYLKVPSSTICFPYLKTLILLNMEILNENFKCDLVKFDLPVLETLRVEKCNWLNVKSVETRAPKMASFNYVAYDGGVYGYSIKIIGDSLANFEFSDVLAQRIVLSGSPVVSATLEDNRDIYDLPILDEIGLQIRKLLRELSSLKDLKLSGRMGKAIAQPKPGHSLPMYYKMEQLTLDDFGSTKALIELLHATPYLKFLCIDVALFWNDWDDYDYDAEEECVPSCVVSRLEDVTIIWFGGSAAEFKLYKFFLKNALQLKTIRVRVAPCLLEKERANIERELSYYFKELNTKSLMLITTIS